MQIGPIGDGEALPAPVGYLACYQFTIVLPMSISTGLFLIFWVQEEGVSHYRFAVGCDIMNLVCEFLVRCAGQSHRQDSCPFHGPKLTRPMTVSGSPKRAKLLP